jgi:hypothetical protein
LTYEITSLPANGTLYDGSTAISSLGSSGYVLSGNQVNYLPNANYNGSDSFTFKTNDGSLDSSPATVSLTVTPVNDAPTASASPAAPTLDEDSQATVTLSGSDLETAAADLTFTITALPAHGSLTKDGSALAQGDSFTGSPADVVYTPDANYNGPDSFAFKTSDGSLDSSVVTVSLTITPVNDAPTASASDGNPDSAANSAQLPEDTQTTVTLSGSDVDTAAADLTFTITALPAHGSLTKDGSALAEGDSFTGSPADVVYTPNANYNGPDSFVFKTSDGSLDSSPATVSLDVTPVNDVPTAHDDHSPSTMENAPPITIDLRPLVSDVETSNAHLTYTIVSGPSHGVLQEISGANGTFSYRSNLNYSGSDSFTYKVTDRGDPDDCVGTSSISCSDRLDSEVKTVPIEIKPSPAPPTSPTPVQVGLTRPRIETVPINQIAKLPRYCASRRHFRIRLRGPRGDRLVKAQVFINGRQVRVVRGRRLTSQVDLRGLPKGRFTVTIIVTTESGRQLRGTRRYHTCIPRIVRKHKRPPKV